MDNDNELYEDKMISAFVGKPEKTLWYKNAFSKISEDKVWHWSWWAFFGSYLFLFYRKAYSQSFIVFILSSLSSYIINDMAKYGQVAETLTTFIVILVLNTLCGGFAMYFIFQNYKQSKNQVEAQIADAQTKYEIMKGLGGVHNLFIVFLVFLLSVLVSFILPMPK